MVKSQQMNTKLISLVVPVFNEEEALPVMMVVMMLMVTWWTELESSLVRIQAPNGS